MLRLKNSYPSVYTVIVNNIREYNTIKADSNPDLAEAQRHTPGELPSNMQAGVNIDTASDPIEQGADIKSSPEQRPSTSVNKSI